jgi:cation diffusion facilitator family transporter
LRLAGKNYMKEKENLRIQKIITIVGILLFIIKVVAYYLTNSVAILTDALESTINVASALFGLYALHLASIPRDKNHPYGHGKIEFISATIEGVLISVAGLIIIVESIEKMKSPNIVDKLDSGIILVGFTALVNYILGFYAVKKGTKNNSIALISSGKHLQTDTYSTLGIILGLIILYFTKWEIVDSIVAFAFSILLLFTGYKIIRQAISGIMDEADTKLLNNVIAYISENRRINWIDIHNLRIIKYGSTLHFDCHVTVPWYFTVNEAHIEINALELLIKEKYGESVEIFVHTDGCLPFSCKICQKTDCAKRLAPFQNKVNWNLDNLASNEKHGAG